MDDNCAAAWLLAATAAAGPILRRGLMRNGMRALGATTAAEGQLWIISAAMNYNDWKGLTH
jgi:hypothetical protein